jgi:hypothetical protein
MLGNASGHRARNETSVFSSLRAYRRGAAWAANIVAVHGHRFAATSAWALDEPINAALLRGVALTATEIRLTVKR